MPAAAIVTLIGVALLVGALARSLGRVALILRRVNRDLTTIIEVLWEIAEHSGPTDEVLSAANEHLREGAALIDGVAASHRVQRARR